MIHTAQKKHSCSSLTDSQLRILTAIEACIEKTGRAPSIRQITTTAGYRSHGTVHRHLKVLASKKYIVLPGYQTIQLLKKAPKQKGK